MAQYPTFSLTYPGLKELLYDLQGKLAKNGIKFKSSRSLSVGDEVTILVRIPGEKEPFSLLGEVSWISPDEDSEGKRVILVRNLQMSEESQARLTARKKKPHPSPMEEIEEAEVEGVPAPSEKVREKKPSLGDLPDALERSEKPRRRFIWLWISLSFLLLLAGSSLWLFFGGLRWIQMNLLSPPPSPHLPPPSPSLLSAEPDLPLPSLPPPPPPKKPAPLLLVDFEYFQRPQENEFIFIFNRPFGEVSLLPGEGPSQVVLFVAGGRVRLEKEQWFFPYIFVKSVLFEESEEGGLKIIFDGKNPDYIPRPNWELSGRELKVYFRENP